MPDDTKARMKRLYEAGHAILDYCRECEYNPDEEDYGDRINTLDSQWKERSSNSNRDEVQGASDPDARESRKSSGMALVLSLMGKKNK